MALEETIRIIADRYCQHKDHFTDNESETRTKLVRPLIEALGYDTSDPAQVVTEYTADVGVKKGEKVDYALKIKGEISILIEVKAANKNLNDSHHSQLFRYFSVTATRLAMLTNGREAWLFCDIDEPNKMDKKPFLRFDFQSYDEQQLKELQKFHRSNFDVSSLLSTAATLKYSNAAMTYLRKQLDTPDEEFVRFIGKEIYDGKITKPVIEKLTPSIKTALNSVGKLMIQEKLGITFSPSSPAEKIDDDTDANDNNDGIETTEEELQAFMIVKAICVSVIAIDRITLRGAKTYCSIFIDNNNRKPVCRFHFNAKTVKRIGLFDENKQERKIDIKSISELYNYSEELKASASIYV